MLMAAYALMMTMARTERFGFDQLADLFAFSLTESLAPSVEGLWSWPLWNTIVSIVVGFVGLPSNCRILNKKNMSIVVPFLGYLLFIGSSIKNMSIVVPFLGYLLIIGSSIKKICPL